MAESTTITRSVKHDFTDEELLAKGNELAQVLKEINELNSHLSAVGTEVKAKIKNLNRVVGELSDHIDSGFAYDDVECDVALNTPVPGVKTITRIDTGDSWEEKMEDGDYNLFTQPGLNEDDIPM